MVHAARVRLRALRGMEHDHVPAVGISGSGLTTTRSPSRSVVSMDSLGMAYGVNAKASRAMETAIGTAQEAQHENQLRAARRPQQKEGWKKHN